MNLTSSSHYRSQGLLVSLLAPLLLAACSGGSNDSGGQRILAVNADHATRSRPALTIEDARASEADGVLRFAVALDRSPGHRIVVNVEVASETAKLGRDFRVPEKQALEFALGVTHLDVVVPLVDDRAVEGREKLRVRLDTVDDSIELTCAEAEGVIDDDDHSYLHDDFPRLDDSFIKLNSAGAALPVDAKSWACVRDRRSGLVWEVKTVGGLHDRDHRYAWRNTDAARNGGNAGPLTGPDARCRAADGATVSTSCNSEDFIRAVNDEGLCGYHDWRLPDRDELRNLVAFDIASPGPTIDSRFFPGAVNGPYWSATPSADRADEAWLVDFWDGDVAFGAKRNTYRLRLVRGERPWGAGGGSPCRPGRPATAPASRFERLADGIRDRYTGLVWQTCAVGQDGRDCENGRGEERLLSRTEATAAAAALRRRSGLDWRLPTVKELDSLLELGCKSPAIAADLFPATPVRPFWSGTASAGDAGQGWFVNFFLRRSYFQPDGEKAAMRLVRSIRDGE